jgi:hypothetical protein
MPSFSGAASFSRESRVPFTPLQGDDCELPEQKRSGHTSTASSIYPTSEVDDAPQANRELAQSGTIRGGRSDSYSGEEFVYSHPYDGHFGAQQGPSYMPARTSDDDRRPMSTGRVVRQVPMASVYGGELAMGSEAELVEDEELRKNSMKDR